MKIVIYPDVKTDLSKYEQLNADDVVVYDEKDEFNTTITKTSDFDIIGGCDVIILTLNCIINGRYDITPIEEVCRKLSQFVLDDKIVVFDTQLPPRSVHKMSKVLDDLGLIEDINLTYTVMVNDDTCLISATNEASLEKVKDLYCDMAENIETTNNIQTAECVPLLQSAYKDVMVAFANQTAILSEAITIDLIEAIKYANMDNDVHLLNPQPIANHDIVRDSKEIINLADEYGETAQLSQTTRDINNYVAYHIAYRAEKELYLKLHLAMFETTVAILGITSDDTLISEDDNVSLTLIDDFVSRDVEVWVCDDKVDEDIIENHGAKKISIDEAYEADCIIIMTDDESFRNIDADRIDKVIISALPILDGEKFKDKYYSSVGQYRLKKGEML